MEQIQKLAILDSSIRNVPWDHPSGGEDGEAVFFGFCLVVRTNPLLWLPPDSNLPHWMLAVVKKERWTCLRQDFQNDEVRSSAEPLPSITLI